MPTGRKEVPVPDGQGAPDRAKCVPALYGWECCRCLAYACCFREGDAPAECRYTRPYGAGAVNGTRIYGVAAVFLILIRQLDGSRKASFTFTREARPEGKGVIRKRGETMGFAPLVRPPRAAAFSTHLGSGHALALSGRTAHTPQDAFFTGFPPRRATAPRTHPTAYASRRAGTG